VARRTVNGPRLLLSHYIKILHFFAIGLASTAARD
jgi:hypothetical protein